MSNYRIARISGISHYPKAVKAFKSDNRGIERRPYKTQMETLARFGFMYGDSFSKAMKSLGNESEEIVYDLDVVQKTWAGENGVPYDEATWMVDILLKQIEIIKPDVIYLQGRMPLPGYYRNNLKRIFSSVRLVVMHYGFPVHLSQLNGLAATPTIHDYFDRRGIDSRLVYHAFNSGVLDHLSVDIQARQNSSHDFTFAGSSGFMLDMMGNPTVFSAHKSRYKFLEEMIKRAGINVWEDDNSDLYGTVTCVKWLRGVESVAMDWLESRSEKELTKALSRKGRKDVNIGKEIVRRAQGMLSRRAAGPLLEDTPVQPLKDIYPESCYPPVFGLEMYQVLARSKIAFNIHTDVVENNVGNIRMFDATGVGACLLTDRGVNMADLFEEDREVATYSSIDECAEKAKYLLDHDDERRKIALAGQRRTLKDHTVKSRCETIHSIIQERLRKGMRIAKSQMIKTPKTRLSLSIPDKNAADLLLEYTLPSILSDINKSALRKRPSAVLNIYCASGLKEKIRNSEQCAGLSEVISIRIEEVEGGGKGDLLTFSRFYVTAMKEALENRDIFFPLEPGQVFSDGAFKRMLDLADAGKLMVMIPELPVSARKEISAFKDRDERAGHRLTIPSVELGTLSARSLGSMNGNALRLPFGYAPAQAIIHSKAGSEGAVVKSYRLSPVMINFSDWAEAPLPVCNSFEFDHGSVPGIHDLYVPGASDETLAIKIDGSPQSSFMRGYGIKSGVWSLSGAEAARYLKFTIRLGKVERVSTWIRSERIVDTAAFFLKIWIKTRSLAGDLITAAKIVSCPRKSDDTNLDKISGLSQDGKADTIAVTMTARPKQINSIVKRLRSRFPDAVFVMISKEGQTVKTSDYGHKVDSVHSLPEGIFRFINVPASILSTRKKIKPDLMILACNNLEGHGYFALKCFVLLCGARKAAAVFDNEIITEISFKHAARYISSMAVRRLIIFPIAIFSLALLHFAGKTWSWFLNRFRNV